MNPNRVVLGRKPAVRFNGEPGEIMVTFAADGMKPAVVKIAAV